MKRKLSPLAVVFLLLMGSSALAELPEPGTGEKTKLVTEQTKETTKAVTEAGKDITKEVETPRKQVEAIAEKLETTTSGPVKWYFTVLFAVFLGFVVGFILYMGYNNLSKSAPIQNIAELPWALPKGSIRATVTLIVGVGVLVLILSGIPVPEILKDAFLVIIAFYFASRKLVSETEVKERPSVDAGKSTLDLSKPAIPADGRTTSTITVTPKDNKGNNLGPGHNVLIETTLGELQGNVQDKGDGTYIQDIKSPAEAPAEGKATISAQVDGIELQAKKQIQFTSIK